MLWIAKTEDMNVLVDGPSDFLSIMFVFLEDVGNQFVVLSILLFYLVSK